MMKDRLTWWSTLLQEFFGRLRRPPTAAATLVETAFAINCETPIVTIGPTADSLT